MIKMYMCSKLPPQKITNEIEEFANKNNIEIEEIDNIKYETIYNVFPQKSTKQQDAAIIYVRFSSANQNEISITGQLEDCIGFCKDNYLDVAAIYADLAQSGTSDNRGAFQRLNYEVLNEKYNEYRYVVYSTNRFARNTVLASRLKSLFAKVGVKVVYSSMPIIDSNEGKIFERTLEIMDEYFSNNLSKTVIRGMKQRAQACKYTGGYVPYGYQINQETKLYEINEKEAENVRLLFKLYNNKVGYTEILRELTARGALSRTGKPFSKVSLGDMISNEKYMGTYVFGKCSENDSITRTRNSHKYKDPSDMVIIPNGIPAIVDEQTFKLAQKRKEENKHGTQSRREKENYLLTGLLVCKECGHSFTGNSRYSGRNKIKYVTYRCTNHNKGEKCHCKEVNRDYLESYVLDVISQNIFSKDRVAYLMEQFKTYQKEHNTEYTNRIKRLKTEKIAAESAKENLFKALDRGLLTDEILQRIDIKSKEIESLDTKINFEENNKPKEIDEKSFKNLIEKTKSIIKNKKSDELRKLISYYISRIEIGKDDITVVFSLHNVVLLCGGDEEN